MNPEVPKELGGVFVAITAFAHEGFRFRTESPGPSEPRWNLLVCEPSQSRRRESLHGVG